MTEDEKRKAIQEMLATNALPGIPNAFPGPRTTNRSADFLDARHSAMSAHFARKQAMHEAYAKQGITVHDLSVAYNEALEQGKRDMVDFRMTFFYASIVIAVHEGIMTMHGSDVSLSEGMNAEDSTADTIVQGESSTSDSSLTTVATDSTVTTAKFDPLPYLERVAELMGEYEETDAIMKACLETTGVDVSGVDPEVKTVRVTRSDRKAAMRMQRTGITEKDLEYEKEVGYENGWNTQFYLTACYAAAALAMKEKYGLTKEQIESVLDRATEVSEEEISRGEILERCARETGLDVSGLGVNLV